MSTATFRGIESSWDTATINNPKSTWEITASVEDTVYVTGETFTLPTPTISAKYTGNSKGYAGGRVIVTPPFVGSEANKCLYYARHGGTYMASQAGYQYLQYYLMPWASGTQLALINDNKYLSSMTGESTSSPQMTFNVADYFPSWWGDDPTELTVTYEISTRMPYFGSGNGATGGTTYRYDPTEDGTTSTAPIGGFITTKIKLNAPPTLTCSQASLDTPSAFANVTTATVTISNLATYCGSSCESIELKIGEQTATRTTNGSLSIALNATGTFTPTVTCTDSLGQKTVIELNPITVSTYECSVSDISAARIDATSFHLDDENGTNALLMATFNFSSYTGSTLQAPTVDINGTTTSNITWYTSWSDANGFSGPVSNWSSVANGTRLYAKITNTFATTTSYTIGIRPKTTTTTAKSLTVARITTRLSQAFYLLAGRAGGHGLGIGMKPSTDAFYLALDMLMTLDTTAQTGTQDGDLYKAITDKGLSSDVLSSGLLIVKELLAKTLSFFIAGTYVYDDEDNSTTSFSFTDPKVNGKERIICGTQDAGNPVLRASISGSTITVYLADPVTLMRVNYICF